MWEKNSTLEDGLQSNRKGETYRGYPRARRGLETKPQKEKINQLAWSQKGQQEQILL